MKFLTGFLLATAALSAAPIVSVSLVNGGSTLDVVSSVTIDGVTKKNVEIGPYTMSMNGGTMPAMCIDFADDASLNAPWNAYVTQVGSSNLSGTYHPTYGQEYEEVAYLFSQITQPNVSTTNRTGLQEAAWDIMAYGITNSSYTSGSNALPDNSYIDAALANYSTMNFSGYEIISDTTVHGEQEFIVDAPEPGSITLMTAGLLVGFGAWRRRNRNAVSAAK